MTSISPVVSAQNQLCKEKPNIRVDLSDTYYDAPCVKHHKAKKTALNELVMLKCQAVPVRKVVCK